MWELKNAIHLIKYTSYGDEKQERIIKELTEQLQQLEAYAELGRAVSKWFKKDKIMEYTGVEIWNEQELLEWAKEVE
jgi:hypothetical protein